MSSHLGTMGVYGYGAAGVKIPEGYLTVRMEADDGGEVEKEILFPASPGSVYHTTKTLDQLLFAFYNKNDEIRVTDLHQGIVWGTQTAETRLDERLINRFDYDGDYGTVLNRFLMQGAVGYPLTVHGTGGQTRAFIHLQDTVRCIELAIEHPPERGDRVRIFNQMTEVHRVIDLAGLVSRLTGAEVDLLGNPRKEADENDLSVENENLLGLGLDPITLEEDLLQEVTEIAERYIAPLRPRQDPLPLALGAPLARAGRRRRRVARRRGAARAAAAGPRGRARAGAHRARPGRPRAARLPQPRPRRRPRRRPLRRGAARAQLRGPRRRASPPACATSTPPAPTAARRSSSARGWPTAGRPAWSSAPSGATSTRPGWQVDADPPEVKHHDVDTFRRQLEETRERLGDHLALYQIHSATPDSGVLEDDAVLDALRELRASGVALGVTGSGPSQPEIVDRARELGCFDTVQATWNLHERSAGPALARAHAAGLQVIVKEALANGRLTPRGGTRRSTASRASWARAPTPSPWPPCSPSPSPTSSSAARRRSRRCRATSRPPSSRCRRRRSPSWPGSRRTAPATGRRAASWPGPEPRPRGPTPRVPAADGRRGTPARCAGAERRRSCGRRG